MMEMFYHLPVLGISICGQWVNVYIGLLCTCNIPLAAHPLVQEGESLIAKCKEIFLWLSYS